MKFSVRVACSIAEVDRSSWNRLSANRPFASYDWLQFGESVCAPGPWWYILVYDTEMLLAAAIFQLARSEPLPLSNRLERWLAGRIFAARPLLICRAPLADWSGLILPDGDGRSEALRLICDTTRSIARSQKVSFVVFDYLNSADLSDGWQKAGYFTTAVPDAGTVLNLDHPDYDAFVSQLPKSVHKDYRRQRNQAAARKITIQAEQTPQSPREMLRLIRAVERHHQVMPKPWAEAILRQPEGEKYTWLAAYQEHRLVGCGLLLNDQGVYTATLLGLDYQVPYTYFQLMYAAIRRAFDQKGCSFRGGSGAYAFKLRLGFIKEDNHHLAFTGGSPVFRWLGKYFC